LIAATTNDLIARYRKHNAYHRTLYRVARIPEALDRGRPFFSDYLTAHLRAVGVPAGEVSRVFHSLAAPVAPSVVYEAESSFQSIAVQALRYFSDLSKSEVPLMFVPPSVRENLRQHRERWGWLSYHGYRDRTLPTETDYVRRLCAAIEDLQRQPGPRDACNIHDQGRMDEPLCSARIEEPHAELFKLYAEIGRVKLLRRYWQLRNFYFLDLLLAEFARRLDVTEWEIRCAFPEEIVSGLKQGHLDRIVARRTGRCAVVYSAE
jgi:hypothetical protein